MHRAAEWGDSVAYLDLENDSPGAALRKATATAEPHHEVETPHPWMLIGTVALAVMAMAAVGGLFALLWIKLENGTAAALITAMLLLPVAPALSRSARR